MSEKPFSVVLVDDEPLARAKLKHYVTQHSNFVVNAEASTGAEAAELLATQKFDVAFLDVEMPDISGFELLRAVSLPPETIVVFVTAYEQYALQAFEAEAMDYLVKPVSPIRFGQLMTRLEKRLLDIRDAMIGRGLRERTRQWTDRVICRTGSKSEVVFVRNVAYIEAARNYAVIHAGPHTHIIRRTLESLESSLDPRQFTRINRSVIVNTNYIKSVEVASHGDRVVELTTGALLTWSRKYYKELQPG